MKRALREQEWALREQEWTNTEFGLEPEGNTHAPQQKIGIVRSIQCQLCATHRIPPYASATDGSQT